MRKVYRWLYDETTILWILHRNIGHQTNNHHYFLTFPLILIFSLKSLLLLGKNYGKSTWNWEHCFHVSWWKERGLSAVGSGWPTVHVGPRAEGFSGGRTSNATTSPEQLEKWAALPSPLLSSKPSVLICWISVSTKWTQPGRWETFSKCSLADSV